MIRRLDWDSRHFGVRIGRVEHQRLDDDAAAAVASARHDFDCIYLLADADDAETAERAHALGFRMVDVRVTFARPLAAVEPPAQEAGIRVAGDTDLATLESIAAESHVSTRFHFDRRFARDRVADLYRIWVRRDFANPAARVFVVGAEGKPTGYTTCTLSGTDAEIGLVALAPEARGSGRGRALIGHALRWAADSGARQARVVTQARNVQAMRLYERYGFECHQTAVWYHLWTA